MWEEEEEEEEHGMYLKREPTLRRVMGKRSNKSENKHTGQTNKKTLWWVN